MDVLLENLSAEFQISIVTWFFFYEESAEVQQQLQRNGLMDLRKNLIWHRMSNNACREDGVKTDGGALPP
jgi:hypothetical protein